MYKLYSERIKNQNGEPEVYVYDSFPKAFRNQVCILFRDLVYNIYTETTNYLYGYLYDEFAREKGLPPIDERKSNYQYEQQQMMLEYYIKESKGEGLLDLIDFSFHILTDELSVFRGQISQMKSAKKAIQEIIDELNYRFKQHGLGYEFINGSIIRIDNKVIHSEFVKPALLLFSEPDFAGAEQEYLAAFEARRQSKNEDAITNAAKAFESVMKTICEKKGYAYDKQKDTAKVLITKLKDNGFFPTYLQEHLTMIAKTLESGAPTMRNKDSGHGQGAEIRDIPDSYVNYVLGLVAVNTVFLVNLYKESK